jgi:hypothetical protein
MATANHEIIVLANIITLNITNGIHSHFVLRFTKVNIIVNTKDIIKNIRENINKNIIIFLPLHK